MDFSKFHVLTMVSNPVRYSSRYRLYHDFKEKIERAGLNLWTAEVAFGHRPFSVTQADDIHDLQLRTQHELWIKERALQLLVRKLTLVHQDWEYIAWLDADIEFPNWQGENAWWKETVQQLQHYKVVQLFETAADLGPSGKIIKTHQGFASRYIQGHSFANNYYENGHPGFAWAIRREAFEGTGGFIDWGVLGSGDRHMATGWVNQAEYSLNHKCSPAYWRKLLDWQALAERHVRRSMGFVPGTIMHHWHGKKKDRQYGDRWKILVDTQFDPDKDIKADAQGLWQLVDHGDVRSIEIRDKFMKYFRARNEDSIDME